jgi:hypothetical protein
MEIISGVGVELAKIGETRAVVEARIGAPAHPGRSRRAVYNSDPGLSITYTEADLVEHMDVFYSGKGGGQEAFFDGVQLTFRFMDEVVADLAARGHVGVPFDIGYLYEPGFVIWSMGSLWAPEVFPDVPEPEDPEEAEYPDIVEGVGVAPFEYFREPTPEEVEAFRRNPPWEQSNRA